LAEIVLGVSPPAQWKACVMGLMAYGSVSGETGFIETLRFLKKKKKDLSKPYDLASRKLISLPGDLAQFPKAIWHKFPSNLV